jgi:hypothetical protein
MSEVGALAEVLVLVGSCTNTASLVVPAELLVATSIAVVIVVEDVRTAAGAVVEVLGMVDKIGEVVETIGSVEPDVDCSTLEPVYADDSDDPTLSVVEAVEEENELDVEVVTVSPAPLVEVVVSVSDIVVVNEELEAELDEMVLKAVVELAALLGSDAVVPLSGVTWPTGHKI